MFALRECPKSNVCLLESANIPRGEWPPFPGSPLWLTIFSWFLLTDSSHLSSCSAPSSSSKYTHTHTHKRVFLVVLSKRADRSPGALSAELREKGLSSARPEASAQPHSAPGRPCSVLQGLHTAFGAVCAEGGAARSRRSRGGRELELCAAGTFSEISSSELKDGAPLVAARLAHSMRPRSSFLSSVPKAANA